MKRLEVGGERLNKGIIPPLFNLQPSTFNLSDIEVCETFAERARGLIGRRELPSGKGMLIPKCNCIHTCFMRFAIDATFLDRNGNVVKVVRNIRPWRLWVWGGWKSTQVLETATDCRSVGRRHGVGVCRGDEPVWGMVKWPFSSSGNAFC